MKRPNEKRTKRRRKILRLWTHEQATAALPYVTSIARSLREHHLDRLRLQAEQRRLAALPGRPDRTALLTLEEARAAEHQASERFQAAIEELEALDIYCLDPVRGEALIPFVRDDQLAWFVFDLFDDSPLRHWRYQSDTLETRRPVTELEDGIPSATLLA